MNASLYVTNCTDLPIGCQQHVPALLEHLQKLQETRLIIAITVFKNNSWIPYAKYVWALFPRARQKGIIQNEWRETRLKTKGWNVIRRQVLPWEIWSCLLNELKRSSVCKVAVGCSCYCSRQAIMQAVCARAPLWPPTQCTDIDVVLQVAPSVKTVVLLKQSRLCIGVTDMNLFICTADQNHSPWTTNFVCIRRPIFCMN